MPVEPAGLPLATLLENVGGAFLLGLAAALLLARRGSDTLLRPLLLTGFLSSFTTFSTLAVEVQRAPTSSGAAVAYPLLSIGAGLAAAAAGLWLGRLAARREPV